eukprot:scaffold30026_cov53-Attheya_sp.AAC.2
MKKFDWKSAYRREHVNWSMTIQTITQMITAPVTFINLRVTFGGKACPSDKILPPKSLPDSVPFVPGLEMIVDVPAKDQGKCNIYLDDGATVVPEIGDNLHHATAAFPLAMHLMCRPQTGK